MQDNVDKIIEEEGQIKNSIESIEKNLCMGKQVLSTKMGERNELESHLMSFKSVRDEKQFELAEANASLKRHQSDLKTTDRAMEKLNKALKECQSRRDKKKKELDKMLPEDDQLKPIIEQRKIMNERLTASTIRLNLAITIRQEVEENVKRLTDAKTGLTKDLDKASECFEIASTENQRLIDDLKKEEMSEAETLRDLNILKNYLVSVETPSTKKINGNQKSKWSEAVISLANSFNVYELRSSAKCADSIFVKAVNCALNWNLSNSVIVDCRKTAIEVCSYFRKLNIGVVNCQILDEEKSKSMSSNPPPGVKKLIDLISIEKEESVPVWEKICQNWWFAEKKEQGPPVSKKYKINIVTMDGDVFKADGEICSSGRTATNHILLPAVSEDKKQKKYSNKDEIMDCKRQLENKEENLEKLKKTIKIVRHNIKKNKISLDQSNDEIKSLKNKLKTISRKLTIEETSYAEEMKKLKLEEKSVDEIVLERQGMTVNIESSVKQLRLLENNNSFSLI
eukprot:GHVL01017032.1.p1 GENE.GHVL01017032.1~~GHVL01017032.1.p1  ORF type:complete len:511 (+),score=129.56 GHVL01017032.1:181-1713(+)